MTPALPACSGRVLDAIEAPVHIVRDNRHQPLAANFVSKTDERLVWPKRCDRPACEQEGYKGSNTRRAISSDPAHGRHGGDTGVLQPSFDCVGCVRESAPIR